MSASRVTGKNLAPLARLIENQQNARSGAFIRGIEQQVIDRWGSAVFSPEGLLTPQARARLVPKGEQPLLDTVRVAVRNPEAARFVTDHMLLLPGASLVMQALGKANGAAGRVMSLLAEFNYTEKETPNGLHVTFCQVAGMSLREMAEEINAHSQTLLRRNAIEPNDLLQDAWVQNASKKAVVHEFTLVKDSKRKAREEQRKCLSEKEMVFAHGPSVVIGAGLRRLHKGVSKGFGLVGGLSDPGDLFEGSYVRVAEGELTTGQFGLYHVKPMDNATDDVIAAGSRKRNS